MLSGIVQIPLSARNLQLPAVLETKKRPLLIAVSSATRDLKVVLH